MCVEGGKSGSPTHGVSNKLYVPMPTLDSVIRILSVLCGALLGSYLASRQSERAATSSSFFFSNVHPLSRLSEA